jgi:dephospho-CoA kinase
MKPSGAAFAAIQNEFPACIQAGKIDRKTLGSMVFNDDAARKKLEEILHPLVIAAEEHWVRAQQKLGAKWVVLDIPLLFETGGEARMDFVLVATAPAFVQKQRVMRRPNMTAEKSARIVTAQLPDRDKRNCADFVVHTGLGKAVSMRIIKEIIGTMDSRLRGNDGVA